MADAGAAAPLDPATRAALGKLADIVAPPPVPFVPQTWGWAVLAAILLAVLAWVAVRGVRRHIANRYRRDALRELDAIEARLAGEKHRDEALAETAELLKRVALAAWPRQAVASLSGDAWVAFLRAHQGSSDLPDVAARFLDDAEYRAAFPDISADDRHLIADAVRSWIEAHVVSA